MNYIKEINCDILVAGGGVAGVAWRFRQQEKERKLY